MKDHKYSDWDERKVKEADIRLFIPDAALSKKTQTVECPFCHEKKFGVKHSGSDNFARCFKCGEGFANPIQAVMHFQGLQYLEALEYVAERAGIFLQPQDRKRESAVRDAVKRNAGSFCRRQLAESGLEEEDVLATVIDGTTETQLSPFRKGRLDSKGQPDDSGDDMLIHYYDLQGRHMTFQSKDSRRILPYIRIRYENPDIHADKDGNVAKYRTPAGAKSRVYIPELIRRLFRTKTHIDTLFLQEGEKKAEKACKHGIPSIGIQGINNFGSTQEGLLQDIVDVAKACSINNIVLIMDSDWRDLSKSITLGDRADKRPNSFASAVIKYRQYMRSLSNNGLSVDIWWGHVNRPDSGEKGVDDLLCGSLKDHEAELKEDIDRAMNSHDGRSRWVDIHKITSVSDEKIRDFWALNDVQLFYQLHKDELRTLDSFRIGLVRYRKDGDSIVAASRYSSDDDIYRIVKDSKGNSKVEFVNTETFRFLTSEGFYRLRSREEGASEYSIIHIDNGVVSYCAPFDVRDYVREYIHTTCKSEMVREFFGARLTSVMSDKQMENLKIIPDDFTSFQPGLQRTVYNNGAVEISASGIEAGKAFGRVWRSQIVPRKFRRVPVIENIEKTGDTFDVIFAPGYERCDFLRYLINTSNNAYRHGQERPLSSEESADLCRHVVNKITTIGYLLTNHKYSTDTKAVIVQDHEMSEVGQSHGGVGKSILGKAISHIVPQFYIDGKKCEVGDKFLLHGVTRATRSVFFDDVKTNFAFQSIFNMVTGDMYVNPKQKDPYTIPAAESPKILITTNHAINGASEPSYARRIAYMEFSAWYSPDHTPYHDFDRMLFDEWDDEQWCLFDNLMAECVMFYLRSFEQCWHRKGEGCVPPPMNSIELRTLRQEMSEIFFQWAEEYFDPSGPNLGLRIFRREMFAAFIDYAGGSQYANSPTAFRRKLIAYCRFKGFHLNVHRKNEAGLWFADWAAQHPGQPFIGDVDKTNSKEYITVSSDEVPPKDNLI